LNLIVFPIALAIDHLGAAASTLNHKPSILNQPGADHWLLSDRGFISFENNGELLISPVAHEDSMKKMGITTDRVVNVGGVVQLQ
jgi:putative restriction endonuclease